MAPTSWNPDRLFTSNLKARGTVFDAQNSNGRWGFCMSKAYCKWPVIVGIIIVGLLLIFLIWRFIRCIWCGRNFCCFTSCCGNKKRQRLEDSQEEEKPPTPVQYTFVDVEDDPSESDNEEEGARKNEHSRYPAAPTPPHPPYRGVFPSSLPYQAPSPMYHGPVSSFPSHIPPAHYSPQSQPEPRPSGQSTYMSRAESSLPPLPPLATLPYPSDSAMPSAPNSYAQSDLGQSTPYTKSSTRFPIMLPHQEQEEPRPSYTPPSVLRPGLRKLLKTPTGQSSPSVDPSSALDGRGFPDRAGDEQQRPPTQHTMDSYITEDFESTTDTKSNAEPASGGVNFSRPLFSGQSAGTPAYKSLFDKE